jgi:uncharacterized protein YfiM (DUF2279 family)
MSFFKILVILFFVSTSLFGFAEDKTKHFQACMIISYTGETLLHKSEKKPHMKTVLYATGISMLVGLGKELYDENDYGGFSKKDLMADALGAFSGALLSHYLNRNYFLHMEHDNTKKKSKIVLEHKF